MDIQFNFAKFQEKVDKEDEIYENFRISAEDYNFPHIYLTDEEIIDFNEECKRAGIDLKVIPLSEYMNISGGKSEEHNIESDIEMLNNSFIERKEDDEEEKTNEERKSRNNWINNDKIENDKNLIGKKHKRKVIETDEEEEVDKKDENNSNFDEKSFKSFKSSIDFNKNKLEDFKLNKDKIRKNNKNKKQFKDKKKYPKKNIEKEKNEKKNKKNPKNNNINDNFNNYFKRIKETSLTYKDEDKKVEKIIKDIIEKSQYLTKEGLKEIADSKHIRLIGDELSIVQLKKLSLNQLANLLTNIEINTKIYKLDTNRKDNIKKIRNKEELEKKSRERVIKKKAMKEEKEKNESLNKKNINNNSNEEKRDDDDFESESSYDEDDALN